jgi:hypothetical protein
MIKKFSKTKNSAHTTAADPKRYSKSKFNREVVMGKNSVEEVKSSKTVTTTPKVQRDYHANAIPEKYQFQGTPREVFNATLLKPSIAQRGYSQLSKGQMVTVEDFGGGQPLRVTSMDKRVGIADHSLIKRLEF